VIGFANYTGQNQEDDTPHLPPPRPSSFDIRLLDSSADEDEVNDGQLSSVLAIAVLPNIISDQTHTVEFSYDST